MLGVPAVSTPIQAIPEVVVDGVTGRIVPPDSAESLAEGVADVLAHRVSYGRAARRHCLDHYEIGVIAGAWDRVIREVTGRYAA
jgi:glycosyltransferase involved in cell wall biosynthesis